MTNSKKSIAARFSASASTYDEYAAVQQVTAEKVLELSNKVPPPQSILEIGCGTGILTEKLRRRFPDKKLSALDVSAGMIKQAQRRVNEADSITWLIEDIKDITCQSQYNCIISSSSLHWVIPIESAFKKIKALLQPRGHLIFGLMVHGTFSELHQARQSAAIKKPTRARLPGVKEILASLEQYGFNTIYHDQDSLKVTFPSANDFITSIHEQGVTGGPVSMSDHLLSRSELANLVAYYDSHYRDSNNQVYATYEIMYVVAYKRN